jgi:hypothetical protein
MDKVSQYQQIVIDYLREFESFGTPPNGLENQLLIDREQHHYQYIIKGWQQNRHFVYTVCLHIDIKDNKIWIWQNNTDAFVGDDLVERGVSKSDIVLAFNAPQERQYTGFATA